LKFIVEAVSGVPHYGKTIGKIKCSTVYKMEQFTQEFLSLARHYRKTKWTFEYSNMLKGYPSLHMIA